KEPGRKARRPTAGRVLRGKDQTNRTAAGPARSGRSRTGGLRSALSRGLQCRYATQGGFAGMVSEVVDSPELHWIILRQVQLETLVQVGIGGGPPGIHLPGEVGRQQQDALLGGIGIVLGLEEKKRIREHNVALPLDRQRTFKLKVLPYTG